MNWREAFFRQARSDNAVRQGLIRLNVEYSHRLHYLQMVTEKLAKAFLADANDPQPPTPVHSGFVRLLQIIKGRRDVRSSLKIKDAASFRAYIDSLLELAGRIERLAPTAAGFTEPNPEYPWRDAVSGEIEIPAEYAFSIFDPKDPRVIKLDRLVERLLQIAL